MSDGQRRQAHPGEGSDRRGASGQGRGAIRPHRPLTVPL
jgi:hypothetical protein